MRRLLCHEPRGHADMYGCFLVPPDDDGAELGVLFWHKDGYSTACGHGTIALGAWAVETGLVAAARRRGDRRRDRRAVRAGRRARALRGRRGRARHVPQRAVVRARPRRAGRRRRRACGSTSPTAARSTPASPAAAARPAGRRPGAYGELIALGRAVKARARGHRARPPPERRPPLRHLRDDPLRRPRRHRGGPHQRNVTVFADGEVDRSPCGSGTCARGRAAGRRRPPRRRAVARHDSIVGTAFAAHGGGNVARRAATPWSSRSSGAAYRTGEHRFVLDPRDPVGTGFVLR